jgi:integrase
VSKRANGTGTVRYNAGRARWEGRLTTGWRADGQPVRKMVTGRTRDDVELDLARLRVGASIGLPAPDRSSTVRTYLEWWIAHGLGRVTQGTADNYRNVVRSYILPHLGSHRLVRLTAAHVRQMLEALDERGLSPNTQRLARSVLRRALRHAEAEGLVGRNVAALADGVRVPAPEGRTLTPAEARVLLREAATRRNGAAITLGLALGLRRGELLGLMWDDLELDDVPATLTIRRALKKRPGGSDYLVLEEPKTRGSRRTIPIPGPVVEVLRGHRVASGGLAGLVFRSPTGGPVDPDAFTKFVGDVTVAAGLGRWSPHELRHSAASILLAQGVPLKIVSEVLGHSSIRITADVYGHLIGPPTEAAAAMERALWQ